MRLRYGVPFTVALLLASSWLSRASGFNAYYLLVGVTAVWVAYDSWRLRIREYATQLALPPIALAAAVAVVWPLMLPLYLRTRDRIRRGGIPKGRLRQRRWGWVVGLAAIVVGFAATVSWATRDARRELLPLARGIAAEFSTGVDLSVEDGWRATVTLPAPGADSTALEDLAFRVARYTHQNHVPELTLVRVHFVDVRKRGALTVTRQTATFEWSYSDLRLPGTGPDSTTGVPTPR